MKAEDILRIIIELTVLVSAITTLIITFRTSTKVIEVKKDLGTTQENVLKVEKATNSMKDALVKATKEAAIAEGRQQVNDETANKATNVAEGHKLATDERAVIDAAAKSNEPKVD